MVWWHLKLKGAQIGLFSSSPIHFLPHQTLFISVNDSTILSVSQANKQTASDIFDYIYIWTFYLYLLFGFILFVIVLTQRHWICFSFPNFCFTHFLWTWKKLSSSRLGVWLLLTMVLACHYSSPWLLLNASPSPTWWPFYLWPQPSVSSLGKTQLIIKLTDRENLGCQCNKLELCQDEWESSC